MSNTSDGLFRKLGIRQKYILKQMLENDYYILKTLDTRDMSVTITLTDGADNDDRDLTQIELQALVKRGLLLSKNFSLCVQFRHEKFYLNPALKLKQQHMEKYYKSWTVESLEADVIFIGKMIDKLEAAVKSHK